MSLNHVPILARPRRLPSNPYNLRLVIPPSHHNHLLPQRIPLKLLQLLPLKRPSLKPQTLLRSFKKPIIIRCIHSRQIPAPFIRIQARNHDISG